LDQLVLEAAVCVTASECNPGESWARLFPTMPL
jgi:hypothetical protein